MLSNPRLYAWIRLAKQPVYKVNDKVTNMTFHNLSSQTLTSSAKEVLGLGLNMIPCPPPAAPCSLISSWAGLCRSVRLMHQFRHNTNIPSKWRIPNPGFRPIAASPKVESALSRASLQFKLLVDQFPIHRAGNISKSLVKALHSLRRNTSLVIKPTDKNLGVSIMDATKYREECYKHLKDTQVYMPQPGPPAVDDIMAELVYLMSNISKEMLPKDVRKYVCHSPENGFIPAHFYVIMKVHKTPPVGRPIAPCHSWCTTNASRWLDTMLRPYVAKQSTYLQDSTSLLIHLDRLPLPSGVILATYDVTALYPSIPIRDALQRIDKILRDANCKDRVAIMALLEWVMTNSYIEFEGQYFKQMQGTAMGTPVAPAFATLFMSSLDLEMHEQNLDDNVLVHKRYLDDGFLVWTGSMEDLIHWLTLFNNRVDQIKLTWQISSQEIDFLDLHLFKGLRFAKECILDVSTFQKSMNCYLYIPASSYHPLHVKKAFISSELKRYLLRSTQESDFKLVCNQFYIRLRARGYSKEFLRPLFASVLFSSRGVLMQAMRNRLDGVVSGPGAERHRPLVMKLDYEPRAQQLDVQALLRQLAQDLHSAHPGIYPPRIIRAWMLPKKFKHFLVRAKLHE